jgi:ribosomal protein S12 methylthiotransferase
VPDEVMQERRNRLMAEQQEIAFAWNDAQIGRRFEVLIDAPVPGEKNAWVGRSYADAPDVDGVVFVSGQGLKTGMLVPCEVVARSGYDLAAAAVGPDRNSPA